MIIIIITRFSTCFLFLPVGDRRADAEDPAHPRLHPETRHSQETAHGPRGGDCVRPRVSFFSSIPMSVFAINRKVTTRRTGRTSPGDWNKALALESPSRNVQ